MYRSNRGFTLVELLVVITIIGILLALLLPGVNMIREQSRQTKCLNNQIQIGKAILTYELSKNHLPGVLNQTAGGVKYTWMEAIFPNLERADLWNAAQNGNTSIASMELKIAICPDDPYTVDPTSPNYQALLSYGVNDAVFVNYLQNPPVDLYGPVAPPILQKLMIRPNQTSPRTQRVNSSSTVMLGERTGTAQKNVPAYTTAQGSFANGQGGPSGKWTDVSGDWTYLTFHTQIPKAPATTITALPISPNILVSAHPGKVCVVFFDGHGEILNNDATYAGDLITH